MLDFSIRPTGPGFIVFHVFLAGDEDGEISMKQGWGNIHYIAQVGNKPEHLSLKNLIPSGETHFSQTLSKNRSWLCRWCRSRCSRFSSICGRFGLVGVV